MKTAILHLSDLHISSESDYIVKKIDLIAKNLRYYTNECKQCIIVVSGDLIDKGESKAYNIVKKFLLGLKKELLKELEIDVQFIIVPGNHDLDLSMPQQIRNMSIERLLTVDIVNENDDELIKAVISPQNDFWNFAEEIMETKINNHVSYKKSFHLENGGKIIFHCYNSSILSTIDERPGSLVIHENFFLNEKSKNNKDIVISVFHHAPSWLSTKTTNNNQRRFFTHLLKETNVIMCGHEHSSHTLTLNANYKPSEILYLEADSFKYGNQKLLDLLVIDDERPTVLIDKYTFEFSENDKCSITNETVIPITSEKSGLFYNDNHFGYLSQLSLPIKHPRMSELSLQDVFVYPDLVPLSNERMNNLYIHKDSREFLLKIEMDNVYFLEGENQAGKTALLKMLSLDALNQGIYPIWINGDDIKHPNVRSLIKRSYKNQYSDSTNFEDFTSLSKENRIILIDNIDQTALNQEGIDRLLDSLLINYKCVIATTKPNTNILSIIRQSDKNSKFKYFHISSFGHLKRNELIEKWFLLGIDPYKQDETEIIDKIKLAYNQITSILSGDLLPAYPPFLLTILHGMSSLVESYNLTPTSYANLYHTLLMTALGRAKVSQDKLNGVITFLTELSYEMYEQKEMEIGLRPNQLNINFDDFYLRYSKERILPFNLSTLVDILTNAGVLSYTNEGNLCFSYKYVYYYLVGLKIASLLECGKGRSELTFLCDNINKEEAANILVFLAYLVKNPTLLLDEIRLTSQIPLNEIEPITLNLNDSLFQRLSSLVKSIKEQILITDIDHKEARKNLLKKRDEEESKIIEGNLDGDNNNTEIETFEDFNDAVKDINTILKSIRVIGQIVKNQNGTLKIVELENLIEDSYLSSFRLIGQFTNLVEEELNKIVDEICTIHKIDLTNRPLVEDHVSKVLNKLLFRLCLSVFSNLALSVGTTDLQSIFNSVAIKIGTPAAHLISFTINSYYGPFRADYLKEIVSKYRSNPVIMNLIQARVRHYVYHHDLPFDKKQQFGQIAGLKLINSKHI